MDTYVLTKNGEVVYEGATDPRASSGGGDSGQTSASMDFYWDSPGVWLDVSIPAMGSASRNAVPPAGWSGSMELAAGKLAGNLTDRIKARVTGVGGAVLYEDADWMSVSGYDVRFSANGPASVTITAELEAHISLVLQHQP